MIHIPITTKYKILIIFSIKLNGQTQLKKWFREMKIKKLSLMGLTSRPSRFSIFFTSCGPKSGRSWSFFLIFDSKREELVGGEMFLHVHHKFPFFLRITPYNLELYCLTPFKVEATTLLLQGVLRLLTHTWTKKTRLQLVLGLDS